MGRSQFQRVSLRFKEERSCLSMSDEPGLILKVFCFMIFSSLFTLHFSLASEGGAMKLSSPDFDPNQLIPVQFTCQGKDISPALEIADMPKGTKSLALIVDDPDAPMGTWVHWVAFDIEPRSMIKQGEIPGIQGINGSHQLGYEGPCPPSGTHRYFFKIYALDSMLGLNSGITKAELLRAMEGHILDQAELVGLYKKK